MEVNVTPSKHYNPMRAPKKQRRDIVNTYTFEYHVPDTVLKGLLILDHLISPKLYKAGKVAYTHHPGKDPEAQRGL
jgi:hypothetical protein